MPSPFQEWLDRIDDLKKKIEWLENEIKEKEKAGDRSFSSDYRKMIKDCEKEIEKYYKLMS